jgi:hypothetical protein
MFMVSINVAHTRILARCIRAKSAACVSVRCSFCHKYNILSRFGMLMQLALNVHSRESCLDGKSIPLSSTAALNSCIAPIHTFKFWRAANRVQGSKAVSLRVRLCSEITLDYEMLISVPAGRPDQ